MGDELEDFESKLILTEEEEGQRLVLDDADWKGSDGSAMPVLVDRILIKKVYNMEMLKSVFSSLWCPVLGMKVKIDMNKALDGGPWTFDKGLVVLSKIDDNINPLDVDLNWCDFFVQASCLPLNKMTKQVAMQIGNKIGRFRSIETTEDDMAMGAVLRDILVKFQFERLPNYCYRCGLMDHIMSNCVLQYHENAKTNENFYQFGPWLRATGGPNNHAFEGNSRRGSEIWSRNSWDD
ncbi:hypothetical protein ACJIZ3_023943 [Penstemon smallii]|uniref:Zinc knuckle CX2CX4HX4C domain-containing protein n=1 Tax=Penstemon smallii TaxID=265156 RepID=A0ABD3TRF3_9LAMI